jgi:hypothetical protein
MKTRLLLTSLLLLTASFLYAQDYSKTEKAIISVIEDETHQINQNNYDGWAAHWIQNENSYLSVAGPDNHMEMLGWETISKWAKKTTENTPVRENDQKKSGYQFTLGEDMAYVTFMEDGNQSTRVLMKDGKDWKIIRVDVVISSAYRDKKWRENFEESVGTWKAVEGSVKNTNTMGMELQEITYYTKVSGHNYIIKCKEHWLDAEGEKTWVAEEFRIPMYREREVMINHNVYSDNWSTLATGKCTYSDGGMDIETTRVFGGTKYCNFKIEFAENGQNKLTSVYYNREGKEIMNTSLIIEKE